MLYASFVTTAELCKMNCDHQRVHLNTRKRDEQGTHDDSGRSSAASRHHFGAAGVPSHNPTIRLPVPCSANRSPSYSGSATTYAHFAHCNSHFVTGACRTFTCATLRHAAGRRWNTVFGAPIALSILALGAGW